MPAVYEKNNVVERKSNPSVDDYANLADAFGIPKSDTSSGSTYDDGPLRLLRSKNAGPKSQESKSDTSNILNSYRSVNYHFTLAALTQENVTYPQSYRNKPLKYVIASTKGKGAGAISDDIKAIVEDVKKPEITFDDFGNEIKREKVIGKSYDYSGKGIVEGFNKESPGRFELYVDNVEIDSIVAPNEQTGTSLSTAVRFEVFEPLSVNGFIEALHTAAIAAGWSGYLNAAYLLKIDFIGYPDNKDLPNPETINATRYIPIKLTGSEMSVTGEGTKYNCRAIPFNEEGYGNPNKIYTDISFTGNTVKEVLENLFTAVNRITDDRTKKEQITDSATYIRDEYELYFPKTPALGEKIKIEKTDDGNRIANEKIVEILKENTLYKFPAKVETVSGGGRGSAQAQEFLRRNPQRAQIQFVKDSQITDIITAVIRDSHYLQGILQDIKKAKDTNGMVDYFQIIINTIPLGVDTTTNVHKYKYQYIVVPYKVHYTKLPGQQTKNFAIKELLPFVKRVYNYIYTGNNVDVLNFKLDFNNLFFQASNPKMGNNDKVETADAAAPNETSNPKLPKEASKDAASKQNDQAKIIPYSGASSSDQARGGSTRSDPYFQLAFNAHRAILESVNLLTAEIDIIGDPYYISTSGQTNYFPGIKQLGLTEDGEADPTTGPVLIRINFRNPVDIDENTGIYKFSELVPFSGVYQVIKVKHIFRNGEFKQSLKLVRFQGQIDDSKPKQPNQEPDGFTNTTKPLSQVRVDTAPAEVPKQGVKPNEVDLERVVDRDFAAASGVQGPETSKLAKVAKAAFGVGAVLAGIDLLKGGLKADVSTIAGMAAVGVGAASLLQQAGELAKSVIPGDSAEFLNSNVVSSMNATARNISAGANNLGKGVSIPTIEGLKTASGISVTDGSGKPILVGSAVSDPAGAVSSIGNKLGNFSSESSSGLSVAQQNAVIADAKAKGIPVSQALQNAKLFGVNLPGVEPSNGSFASKLGIDPKALSRLTGADSKIVDQLKQAAEEIPKNTNLEKLKEQGVVMANLNADSFRNLPGVPPVLKAPRAAVPSRSIASALTPEQRSAVIADAKAKGVPVDQALRNASMFGINIKGLTPEAQAIAISNNPQQFAGNTQALAALGISSADINSGKFESIANQMKKLNPDTASLNDIAAGMSGAASSLGGPFSGSFGGIAGGFNKLGVGSKESLQGDIQSAFGNPGTNLSFSDISKSVSAKFGSLTSSAGTPLNKLMNTAVNKLNDPNAPPYTGTDPIIRARLGLPPAVDDLGNEIT